MHHPFTAPKSEDLEKLESAPGEVRARAYDLVLNGVELGGGSIRIHRHDVQARLFKALGIDDQAAQEKFGFLLEAFKYGRLHTEDRLGLGSPCHVDGRLRVLRDVIAFPKTQRAMCLMTEAPSEVDPEQLKELHLHFDAEIAALRQP